MTTILNTLVVIALVSVIMGLVTVADILFALESPFAIGGAA